MRLSLFSRYTCFALCILIFIVSLFYLHHVEGMWILTLIFGALTLLGCHDVLQKPHAICRNYPVIGRIRFLIEFIRPELRQYLLEEELKQQMNRIIEHRSDGLTFHHQAIAQVEQDGRRLVEQSMGGVMQDSMNEMGLKQATSGGNPLQAMMSNLGGLQQAVQAEWRKNETEFQSFGNDVCKRVTSLETQRKSLLAEIKN